MNIFYIPSWFPSKKNPIFGTFVKEQIELLSSQNPSWNLGISTWGQGDPDFMLWAKDNIFNMLKIGNVRMSSTESKINDNLTQYFSPCLTWTRKVANGNLKGLFKANEINFDQFKSKVQTIDVIHAQASYPAALIARYLSIKHNIPYVVTIRMSPFPFQEFLNKDGSLGALIATPLQQANQLIATSHSLKNTLNLFGLSKVTVVNNPVDILLFQPSEYQTNELCILSIGRLEPQKGYDILIRSIALLTEKFKGIIRIGGDGSQRNSLKQLTRELGVEDKFEWLGELTREQVVNEMQQCSFYVLSSRHETFGNVLLEALACGKPVVATKCGGPIDIMNEQVGLLCEPNNAEALAKTIDKMISIHQSFSRQDIRQYVKENFSSELFSNHMKSVYDEAIESFQKQTL